MNSNEFCLRETMKHVETVRHFMGVCVDDLQERARVHDASKFEEPEFEVFAENTAQLRDLTFGSDAYKAALKRMKPALDHHYANNSHHPEFFENGVAGMNLLDLMEMVCDWSAACRRHKDGDPMQSLDVNAARFNLDGQMVSIIRNTLQFLLDKESAVS